MFSITDFLNSKSIRDIKNKTIKDDILEYVGKIREATHTSRITKLCRKKLSTPSLFTWVIIQKTEKKKKIYPQKM